MNLEIPKDLKPAQRAQLADLVIDHIVERTLKGKDKDGDKFPGYSKAYVQSLAFRSAGKSPKRVDLTLSGEMLDELRMLNHAPGKIRIGFENGTDANAKAEGNILGSYGRSPDPSKARDFLGVQKSDLKEMIAIVRRDG
jgi:hypothetical protein